MSMSPNKQLNENGTFSNILNIVYENNSLAILAMDGGGTISHWSAGAERLLGYSAEEMIGQHYSVFSQPQESNQQGDLVQEIRNKIQSGQMAGPYQVQRTTKSGELLNVHQTWQPIIDPVSNSVTGLVCVFVDITDQKRAETALVEQVDQIKAVVETVLDAIITIDGQGMILAVNPAVKDIFGYEAAELIGQNVKILMPAPYHDEHDSYIGNFKRTRQAKIIGIGREVTGIRKNGEKFAMELAVNSTIINGSEAFVGVVKDISARKQQELALVEQVHQIQAIVETVLDGIVTIDAQGIILAINPAVERIFGYQPEELLGHNVKILMPNPYRDEHDTYIENFKRTREAKIIGIGREVTGIRKNGDEFPMDLAVNSTIINGKEAFVGVIKDISARKEQEDALTKQYQLTARTNEELKKTLDALRSTQAELIDAEKMASLGAIVAGVAHEINTPVGVCLTAISHLSEETQSTSTALNETRLTQSGLKAFFAKSAEAIALIQRNLERAAKLIGSFKQLSLDQANERVHNLNLLSFLNDTLLAATQELTERNCSTTLDCPPNIYLTVNQAGLLQVIRNLLLNAAIHGYGERGGNIHIHVEDLGNSVLIQVSDTGKGMPNEIAAKVFDPFFTTRRSGGSMGLGMHLVYNLVNQSLKGKISVETDEGKGTTFSITLPK